MKDFHSKTLNKTFDRIIFAGGFKRAGLNSGAKEQPQVEVSASGGSKGSRTAFVGEKVEKAVAPNAYTVEEVFAQAEALSGKKVTVRAKAVKVSPNIMKKTWLHLQDGTGQPDKATHDLVVTTLDTAAFDTVVTIEGTVAVNKDFGHGYKYAVIIEDATVTK